ncbi:MAG: helix-turn-helix transcriptional regulator [Cyclobacteriaceae bacterium]
MSYFNKNIRYYRIKRRITQDAFADYLNIKKGKLIAWEHTSEPKFDELIRVCKLLKVNLIDFITQDLAEQSKNELGTIINLPEENFSDEQPDYRLQKTNIWDKNIDKLDVFSIIDRVIQTNDTNARRQMADALKTEMGKLLLDLSRQKEKNITLLEQVQHHSESKRQSDQPDQDPQD